MCAAKVYDNLFHGTCLYVTSCLKYILDFIREHLVPYEESGESLDPMERQCAAHCPGHLFHESGCPAGTASFTDKKSPTTRMYSRIPGLLMHRQGLEPWTP